MGKEYVMCVYSLYIRLRETILTTPPKFLCDEKI